METTIENGMICIDCSSDPNRNDCIDCNNYKNITANESSSKLSEDSIDLREINTFDGWNADQELKLIDNLLKLTNQTCIFDVNNIENDKLKSKIPDLPSDYLKHIETWFTFFSNKNNEDNNDTQTDEYKLYKERTKLTLLPYKESLDSNNNQILANSISNPSELAKFPMRPQVHSKLFRSTNGYRCARGDFETEYDDQFEFKCIADLDYNADNQKLERMVSYLNKNIKDDDLEVDDESDDESQTEYLEFKLKLSLLKMYNRLIRKRYKLKKFVRDFGLLNEIAQNEPSLFNKPKIPVSIQNVNTPNIEQHLKTIDFELPKKFQNFFDTYEDYAKFSSLINHRNSLIQQLINYEEYRSKGIKSNWEIAVYKNLKLKRLNRTPSVHMGSLINSIGRVDDFSCAEAIEMNKMKCMEWFRKFVIVEKNLVDKTNTVSSQFKFKNVPLKIEAFPESDKLDEEEKEFCRVTRIQPTTYLRVKDILCADNKKNGFCSYSRARKIAGIDVNKTRVIHNFMLKVNLIKANPPNEESKT